MEINMNSKPFSAQIRLQPEAVTIDLQGEIDAFAEAELNAAYTEAEAHNPSKVMLNFQAVNYINSTGIALIVGTAGARPQSPPGAGCLWPQRPLSGNIRDHPPGGLHDHLH
jgi:hypothetical protein